MPYFIIECLSGVEAGKQYEFDIPEEHEVLLGGRGLHTVVMRSSGFSPKVINLTNARRIWRKCLKRGWVEKVYK
tara:strand:- start:349 stop:570 length:222 start_codon:yes stop_codon:yes gene_type:complete